MTDALRTAAQAAMEALEAFTDPEGDPPENTGEWRDAMHALADLRAVLAAQPQGEQQPVEWPDDGELEAWRKIADDLLNFQRGEPSASTLRRAAHLLQNAYLFASKAKPAPQPQGAQPDVDPLWPIDGLYPDMQPPVTSRDRWMFDQGRLAERRQGAQRVAQPLIAFTPAQRGRLYANSPEHHKDATSRAGFERIVTLTERAHGIGEQA